MNSRKPAVIPLFLVALIGYTPGTAQESYNPPEMVLRAKVRDFKEMNPTDTAGNHPHFNNQNGCSAQDLGINTVEAGIDSTGPSDGASFPGDHRTPTLAAELGAMARCYDPPERFPEWFSDRGPDTNRSYLVELRFMRDTATGLYRFQDDAFFPIDSGKPYAKFQPSDPEPFGHLHPDTGGLVDLSAHNYGFTMELHTAFKYEEGKGQVFTFAGDDDIWVFLNGKRVIDLGGLHTTETGTADLDSLKEMLGLEDGKTYPLDFFFAERHTSSSKCLISTNLAFNTSIPVVAAPKASPAAGPAVEFPAQVSLATETPEARIYYTLDGSEPDSTKTLYASSVTVAEGAVLKAIAYRSGWIPSAVMVESYQGGVGLARDRARARLDLGPGEYDIAIFDRAGRQVRRMPAQRAAGTPGIWDGRDAQGRPSSPGVYFWRATAIASSVPVKTGLITLSR